MLQDGSAAPNCTIRAISAYRLAQLCFSEFDTIFPLSGSKECVFPDVVDVLGGQGLVYFIKEIGRVYKHAHFGTPIADFNGFRLTSAKSIEIRNVGTDERVYKPCRFP